MLQTIGRAAECSLDVSESPSRLQSHKKIEPCIQISRAGVIYYQETCVSLICRRRTSNAWLALQNFGPESFFADLGASIFRTAVQFQPWYALGDFSLQVSTEDVRKQLETLESALKQRGLR